MVPSAAFSMIVSPNGAPCLPLMSLSSLPLLVGCTIRVRSIGAPNIEVFDPKSALAAGEHLERFRLVLLHRNDDFLEQGFGFPRGGEFALRNRGGSEKNLSRGESGG